MRFLGDLENQLHFKLYAVILRKIGLGVRRSPIPKNILVTPTKRAMH